MMIVSIVAADGYEFNNEMPIERVEEYLDLVVAVLRPDEGVMIRAA